jgi:hypothetical protein
MVNIIGLVTMITTFLPLLDERQTRIFVALDAKAVGHGGVSSVSSISGISRVTITNGIKELDTDLIIDGKIRRKGAGRPTLISQDLTLLKDLEILLEESTIGNPENPIRHTNKSSRTLAKELQEKGHKISHVKVFQLLKDQNFGLRGCKKELEGNQHEDRDQQFHHINSVCKQASKEHQPVLSVDTKKKELIGNYKNPGQKWMPKGINELVGVHDFPEPSIPKAIPFGIFDIGLNTGFVNVGTDHDTSSFAVNSIKRWRIEQGKKNYPNIKYIVITADCGGSNGYRTRLWKYELQKLVNYIGVDIIVCHYPQGTSKWNKIEHRLFSFISSNWRAKPLKDYETIVNLIKSTTTSKGLKVKCKLDRRKYPIGLKISNKDMDNLNIIRNEFHGEWNYTLLRK